MPRALALLTLILTGPPLGAGGPVSLHPDNPRYFKVRGRPTVLVTATEHYGSVINRPFDYEKYLADHAARGLNLTRTFLLFRELQTARNPYSTCKPETDDYIAPYPRVPPGDVNVRQITYDLDRWNPEFFERLGRFLAAADRHGVVVELTLFSNTYDDSVWSLNPLNAVNNKQGVGKVTPPEYITLRDAGLVARQKAFARKVVRETARFDNVYYEVCNEPTGGYDHAAKVTPEEVDAWLTEMAATVRDELKQMGRTHLVVGAEALCLLF
jgi:hypothetical protein